MLVAHQRPGPIVCATVHVTGKAESIAQPDTLDGIQILINCTCPAGCSSSSTSYDTALHMISFGNPSSAVHVRHILHGFASKLLCS